MASSVWTVGENAQQQLAGARPCGPEAVARLPLVNTSTAVQTRHMEEARSCMHRALEDGRTQFAETGDEHTKTKFRPRGS
ncbi:hypothetical protein ON010_g13985 [Phytophthora cinnamomi]|nr:hypothetical protein ON010_g13985 [Phytophthora cinnamomi]